MYKLLISIVIFIAFIGCTNEVDIEQAYYQPKVVVDGWIENDRRANIFLTQSSPYLTEFDSASIRATFLNHAKITLYTDNGESEILTLSKQSNFFPPFVYKSIKIKGKIGETYHITIEVNNQIITATTTIPTLPSINSIYAKQKSDTTFTINALLSPPNKTTYYYSQIKILGIDNQLHASAFPIIKKENDTIPFFTLDIPRKIEPDPLHLKPETDRKVPVHEYLNSDTVLVTISTIDQTSFEVLNAFYIDLQNKRNPFSFIKQQTPTNIIGGIGCWSGLGTVRGVVYLTK